MTVAQARAMCTLCISVSTMHGSGEGEGGAGRGGGVKYYSSIDSILYAVNHYKWGKGTIRTACEFTHKCKTVKS